MSDTRNIIRTRARLAGQANACPYVSTRGPEYDAVREKALADPRVQRGTAARAIITGRMALSLAGLEGRAKTYAASYARARERALAAWLDAGGTEAYLRRTGRRVLCVDVSQAVADLQQDAERTAQQACALKATADTAVMQWRDAVAAAERHGAAAKAIAAPAVMRWRDAVAVAERHGAAAKGAVAEYRAATQALAPLPTITDEEA